MTAAIGTVFDAQADFAASILDPARPLPAGLIGPDGHPSDKRFAVYRNNVMVGLIEALKDSYPVVHRLVGEAFFSAMARLYAAAEPPASPVMLDYGAGFAAFIARFEPAAVLPWLPDVARLERAWLEAYHAAEATPLSSAALTEVPMDEVADLRLILHPSVRIVPSAYPIVTIWLTNIEAGELSPIDIAAGEDALITRIDADVEVRRLPEGSAAFIAALGEGAPILDAIERSSSVSPSFDLAHTLQGMAEANLIIGFKTRAACSMEAA